MASDIIQELKVVVDLILRHVKTTIDSLNQVKKSSDKTVASLKRIETSSKTAGMQFLKLGSATNTAAQQSAEFISKVKGMSAVFETNKSAMASHITVTGQYINSNERLKNSINQVAVALRRQHDVRAKSEHAYGAALGTRGKALTRENMQWMNKHWKTINVQTDMHGQVIGRTVAKYEQFGNQMFKVTKTQKKMGNGWKDSMPSAVQNQKLDSLLGKFTKARWLMVNFAMAGALVAGVWKTLVQPTIEYEVQMAEVQRTTGLTIGATRDLGDKLKDLSRTMPIALKDLADVARIAGQIGIGAQAETTEEQLKQVTNFTKTVSLMTSATEMSAEKAAESLAKLSAAFNLSIDSANRYASAIAKLGIETAATASEISESAMRVAPSAASIGLSIASSAAMQATLIGAGMKASRAGTRIRNALVSMAGDTRKFFKIVDDGTMTFEDFTSLLNSDADAAFDLILRNLYENYEGQERLNKVVELFGKVGGSAISLVVNKYPEFHRAVEIANDEMRTSLSLLDQYATKLSTTAGMWDIFRNKFGAFITQTNAPLLEGILGSWNMMFAFNKEQEDAMAQWLEMTGQAKWYQKGGQLGEIGVVTLSPFLLLQRRASLKSEYMHYEIDRLELEWRGLAEQAGVSEDAIENFNNTLESLEVPYAKYEWLVEAVKNIKVSDKDVQSLEKDVADLADEMEISALDFLEMMKGYSKLTNLYEKRTFLEQVKGKLQDPDANRQWFSMAEAVDKYINKLKEVQDAEESGNLDEYNLKLEEMADLEEEITYQHGEFALSIIQSQPEVQKLKEEIDDLTKAMTELEKIEKEVTKVQKKIDITYDITTTRLKDNIEALEETYDMYQDALFVGESEHLKRLHEIELAIKKEQLAQLGLKDSVDETNNSLETEKAEYEAWVETVHEAIRALVKEGNNLSKNVSKVVKEQQTALLSTARYAPENDKELTSLEELEQQQQRLQLEYEIQYDEKHRAVEDYIDAKEREGQVEWESVNQAITAINNTINKISEKENKLNELEKKWSDAQIAVKLYEAEIEEGFEDLTINRQINKVNSLIKKWKKAARAKKDYEDKEEEEEEEEPPTNNLSPLHIGTKLVSYGKSFLSPSASSLSDSTIDYIQSLVGPFTPIGLAEGGLVTKPTFSLLGEEGPEVVIPLKEMDTGTNVTISNLTINGAQGDPKSFADEFIRTVKREMRTS